MKKMLVTGATGFIGKRFVQYLIEQDIAVRVLVRCADKAKLLPKEVEVFVGDLTNPDTLSGVCNNIDTVFHLGGYAHASDDSDPSFIAQHEKINYQGTCVLLDESQQSHVKRFVFFSSVKAVADCETTIDESWDASPNTPYGIAKRKAEDVVLQAKNNGMHVCVLRLALTYGPEWKGNLAKMLNAVDKGIFPPIPPLNNSRSLICIEDVCSAALLAANHPNANGKIYFLTDGQSYSTYDIYTLMCDALGKRKRKWHIPFICFRLIAKMSDLMSKILRRRMPFNSETLHKLFGSASYNSKRIRDDLGFSAVYDLKNMLPFIIKSYTRQVKQER